MQSLPFRLATEQSVIVIPSTQEAAVLPHRVVERRGYEYMLLPHRLEATRLLRNLGFKVPSPIITDYDWAGHTPFESQKLTAAMLTLSRRAYCLNEFGTGKTLAALFAYDYLRQMGQAHKMLVVAPLSTLNTVWAQEVFRWMPHLEVSVLHGTKPQRLRSLDASADIYVINHDGVKVILPELLARKDIDAVLIDELAVYRNRRTNRWKVAEKLLKNRKWAWGLTGGPTPKEPTDAWAQVRLLTPERTTWSFKAFREAVMLQVSQFRWVPRDNALDTVHKIMQPSVRFKREECVDLPPTTYSMRYAELSKEQARAYKEMDEQFIMQHPSGQITAMNAGVQMGKLIQICCGFAFGENGRKVVLDHKSRTDVMLEVIEQAESKVIVFAPYKPAISLIEDGLRGHYSFRTVTGDTPKRERDEIFNEFQHAKDPHVLVAHPKVAAHGLTLTAANTILWYGVLPDLEIYEQACARVARPGQKLHTHITHIVATAAEQKVARTLERRGNVQATLLEMFSPDNR